MLPEAVATLLAELNSALGDCLLVDARRGRVLLSDAARIGDVCKGLRRGGFTRALDFTAMHLGSDAAQQQDFAFYLALRAPKYGHCLLNLKWKWRLEKLAHPSLGEVWPSCALAEREMLEMFGIPFAGNEGLRPLLLDSRFTGYPLRRGYQPPPQTDFASELLRDRHEAGLIFGLRQAVGAEHAPPAADREKHASPLPDPEEARQ